MGFKPLGINVFLVNSFGNFSEPGIFLIGVRSEKGL